MAPSLMSTWMRISLSRVGWKDDDWSDVDLQYLGAGTDIQVRSHISSYITSIVWYFRTLV